MTCEVVGIGIKWFVKCVQPVHPKRCIRHKQEVIPVFQIHLVCGFIRPHGLTMKTSKQGKWHQHQQGKTDCSDLMARNFKRRRPGFEVQLLQQHYKWDEQQSHVPAIVPHCPHNTWPRSPPQHGFVRP